MVRLITLVFCLLFLFFQLAAQTQENIKVNTRKTPLNEVLLGLKADYGFQFAFDNDLLSQYKITVTRTFHSQKQTLEFLIKNLPLEIEKSGNVFLILRKREKEPEDLFTRISGQVLEARTHEPLPYSYVLVNRKPVQSDQQGHFNFLASSDSVINLQISHLGYFIYDTIVTQSINRKFFLTPQITRIKEVRVLSNPVEKSTLIGDKAGHMKLNHQIAPILPGHGDNSVFNLLRLMPGVLASGESSNDLLIWGAYESHSKVQFDGFTLFGLKNFNDNIAVVNPFLIKNIEVMKGGYQARYGGRVGGIVDIAGKDGQITKPGFIFNINSTTLNSMMQVPLSKKSTISVAYRQTYYQLYDPTSVKFFVRNNAGQGNENAGNSELSNIDLEVQPDFSFRDANLKYTFKGNNGSHFTLSLYGGGDEFLYGMEGQTGRNHIKRSEEEENLQMGGSLQFNYPWYNGNSTNLTFGYSAFGRQTFEQNIVERNRPALSRVTRQIDSDNTVNELSLKAEHYFTFKKGHKLIVGAGAVNNQVELLRKNMAENELDLSNSSFRLFSFLQDELPVGEVLNLKTGLRMIYVRDIKKWYIEPRVSASLNIIDGVKLNASWGLYNQFISKATIVDSSYQIAEFWMNSDDVDVPVLHAQHYVAGISFNKNGFTLSTEGFYKTTEGLTRFFNGNNRIKKGFLGGSAKAYGVDIYFKKEYKRNMAWVAYTLSQTEEHFPFYVKEYYRPSPHHQKHELKFAGVLNYKWFYLSANYVYGSGFERYDYINKVGEQLNKSYNRLDASLVYKFSPGKVKAEAGISILNVLDTENIKYSNLGATSIDEISLVGVYADAVRFTPAVFFKIEL